MKKKETKSTYEENKGQKQNSGSNLAVMVIGVILSAVFAASTAYSGMKSGLTVAAGIPGAIIGSMLVGIFARRKNIFGKNIIQGMSSGGESIASGIIYVLPAIILIGSDITFFEGLSVSLAGALFGIGALSLVYNYLIIEEDQKLMYPEALAISETLSASEEGGDAIKYMGIGFVISGIINILTGSFLNYINNTITFLGSKFYKWRFSIEVNPLLLGIGFIVCLEVAVTMFAGSVLANFGIAPLIGYFTDFAESSAHSWNNPSIFLNQMDVNLIAGNYVKYIGAGMMLCGGLIGAIKLIPTIVFSIKETLKSKSGNDNNSEKNSGYILILLVGIILTFVAAFIISKSITMAILAAIVSLILALLFVIVAGRLTGTIGTSNLPVSGMTIASLVILTLVFVGMGWTDKSDNKSLLLFALFMVVSISVAAGYSQSQKVTYMIKGKKKEMQNYFVISSIVGVFVVIGTIIILKDQIAIIGVDAPFALPQANLMATLTAGIMSGDLPWPMIIVGVVMALFLFLLNLPIMTVAIGFYLPISTTSIILVGALIRLLVEKMSKNDKERDLKVSNGISLSSGLVAGGSIIGLIGIILQLTGIVTPMTPAGFASSNTMGVILLIVLVIATTIPIMGSKVKETYKNK